MDRIQRLAEVSVGRACLFAGLAISVLMAGLVHYPLYALKAGAILASLATCILLMKALNAPRRSYRRTELWVLLDRRHGLEEAYAQRVIAGILYDTFMRFAGYAALIALVLWVLTLAMWAFG